MSTYVRRLTKFGAVLDRDGDSPEIFSNLEELLIHVFKNKPNARRSQKVRVLQSCIAYPKDHRGNYQPYRYEIFVTRTLGGLLRYYKRWNGTDGEFNVQKAIEKREVHFRVLEAMDRRQEGWGLMNAAIRYMNHQRAKQAQALW